MDEKNKWIAPIYHENRKRLLSLARQLLSGKDVQIAEDMVHKTFVKLLEQGEEIRNHPNVAGWLCRTLANVIHDEVRLAQYRMEVPLMEWGEPAVSRWEEDVHCELPAGLTKEEKELLLLIAVGYKPKDIAKMKGITAGACRVRLMRARQHFREIGFQ